MKCTNCESSWLELHPSDRFKNNNNSLSMVSNSLSPSMITGYILLAVQQFCNNTHLTAELFTALSPLCLLWHQCRYNNFKEVNEGIAFSAMMAPLPQFHPLEAKD